MRNPLMVGRRIYLTAEEAADARPFARAIANESETFFSGLGRMLLSPLAWDALFEGQAEREEPPDYVLFNVLLRESDEFVGQVGLEEIDWINRTAESSSWLRPGDEWRGRGYGTEAKMLLLEYGFDRLGLHLIYSAVNSINTRSAAALAKQGYRPAGKLKYRYVKRGRYEDQDLFDLTRDEWITAKERWEAGLERA